MLAVAANGVSHMAPEELAEMLYKSLMKGDDAMMRAVARQAVKRFAGMEPGRPVGGTSSTSGAGLDGKAGLFHRGHPDP